MRASIPALLLILALYFSFILPVHASGEENVEIIGIPDNGRLVNPLNATVIYENPEGDPVTVSWFLDGEPIGEGFHIQRYIYPGKHNLTVRIDDKNSTVIERYFTLDPVPPPGWGEEPDNSENRLIFWIIFGIGGIIFASGAAWVWFTKGPEEKTDRKE